MRMIVKIIAFFTVFSILLSAQPTKASPIANMTHRIAGYGPVFGEYVMPKTIQFFNNKIYIQDQFGISIVDQKSRHLDKRFPINTGSEEINKHWDKKESWLDFFSSFSMGLMGMMDPGSSSGLLFPGLTNSSLLKSKISFDSTGKLYVPGVDYLSVYQPETGALLSTINFPPIKQAKEDIENPTSFICKIYHDQLFLLESKSNMDPIESSSTGKMYVYSLSGELQQEIVFEPNPETSLMIIATDFFYDKNLNLFGLLVAEMSNMERCPVQFFSMEGKEVTTTGNLDQIMPSSLEIQEPARVILSGLAVSMGGMGALNSSIFVNTIKKNEDGSIELIKEETIKSNKFGMMTFDLATDGNDIGLITTGPMEAMLDCRIYHIVGKEVQRLGSYSNKEGQIFGSIASTVDKEGNLYETSIGNSVINKYDKNGKYLSQIKMDLKEISSMMGLVNILPTVMSIKYDSDYIYCTNLFPNTLSRYSVKENVWEKLFEGELFSPTTYLWFSMEMVDDRLYLLDSSTLNEGSPNLSYLDVDNTPMIVNLANSPEINEENPPMFISMIINDKEMQFLDATNNEIWIYSRMDETFKEKIKIPTEESNFYISFDEYTDNSWVISDVIQNRLLHLSRKGLLLETIGSKGILSTGNTKEDYTKIPEQFYRPVHVEVIGNLIYVSDLMNCRYHIISPEKKPELVWNEEAVLINDFPIFEKKQISISFNAATSRDFSYSVSSESAFVKVDKTTGVVSEKKILFTVLGEKLIPWKSNIGSIKISFPDYPSLNKEIPITINAIGKVVKLTIGSEKAIVNGKEFDMGKGAAPMVKKGRTFVGIRFLGETVFNATVNFDAKARIVIFELNAKKIELFIDQPYATVNGVKVTLDAPPFIQSGRTLVPLRFISENLEATVDYEAKTQTITISFPKK